MNNPYLVCSDRELRILPTQWLLAEQWDEAGSLLYDLEFMEAKVRRLGIDELLQDYATAQRLLPEAEDWRSKVATTNRALDRQAHHLREWDAQAQPAFFLQQLRNEAFQLDLDKLKMLAEKELAEGRLPYLLFKSKASNESPEIVRTIVTEYSGIVALSTDGRLAVSLSAEKTLKVWDVATGRELRTLKGHSDRVWDVALSADGRLAISASGDKTLKVWDVAMAKELRTLTGHSDVVTDVVLSADGRLAVSASRDMTLKVWNVATGHEVRTLKVEVWPVTALALSADGRLAVSTSMSDTSLQVWDIATGQKLRTLKSHWDVVCVALSADGQLAISASDDGKLKVWDVATGRNLHKLNVEHSVYVKVHQWDKGGRHCVALSADGRLAVSASPDWTVNVWDVATGRELCTLDMYASKVNDVALSADGRLAISASENGILKVWDIAASHEPLKSRMHSGTVTEVALSTDGRLAVSASKDNTLKVWDVATGRELHTLQWLGQHVNDVGLSADGRLAVAVFAFNRIIVWDVETGRQLRMLKRYTIFGSDSYHVKLSADGHLAVSSSWDKTFWGDSHITFIVWDVATGRQLYEVRPSDAIDIMALSANGRLAVSASRDKTLKVWDVASGYVLSTFAGHSLSTMCIALSADGRLAISTLQDNKLQAWEVETGRELRTIEGHLNDVNNVALSANGRLAVSVSDDKTLKVLDVATGQAVSMLQTNLPLRCCAMTPDGKTIVAGDQLGEVYFLELVGADEIHKPRKG